MSTVSSDTEYVLQPLRGKEDYDIWSIKMEALLSKNALKSYILKPNVGFEEAEEGEMPILTADCEKARSHIVLNLRDGPLIMIKRLEHPYQIWEALKELYGPKGFYSEFLILSELFATTLQGHRYRMEDYINTVKRLSEQLRAKDIIMPDKAILAWVLHNLTPEYDTLTAAITQSITDSANTALNLAEIFSYLVDKSKRLEKRDEEKESTVRGGRISKSGKASQVGPYRVTKPAAPSSLKQRCSYCKKTNHTEKDCYFKHPSKRPLDASRRAGDY